MAETLNPICFICSTSCTSFPRSTSPHLLPNGVNAGIHHFSGAGEFSTGTLGIIAPAVTLPAETATGIGPGGERHCLESAMAAAHTLQQTDGCGQQKNPDRDRCGP